MRKIHKIVNIALIFTLIGVFALSSALYAVDFSKDTYLRVPLMCGPEEIAAEGSSLAQDGKLSTKRLIELIGVVDNDKELALIKDELLYRAKDTMLITIKTLITFLFDQEHIESPADKKCSEFSKEFLLEISKKVKTDPVVILLIEALIEARRKGIVKELILDIADSYPRTVAEPLAKALTSPKRAEIVEELLFRISNISEMHSAAVAKPLVEGLIDPEHITSIADQRRAEISKRLILEISKKYSRPVARSFVKALGNPKSIKSVKKLILVIADSYPCSAARPLVEALSSLDEHTEELAEELLLRISNISKRHLSGVARVLVEDLKDPEYIRFPAHQRRAKIVKRLILEISKKNSRPAIKFLAGALGEPEKMKPAKELILEIAQVESNLVIDILEQISGKDNRPKVRVAADEILVIIKSTAKQSHTLSKSRTSLHELYYEYTKSPEGTITAVTLDNLQNPDETIYFERRQSSNDSEFYFFNTGSSLRYELLENHLEITIFHLEKEWRSPQKYGILLSVNQWLLQEAIRLYPNNPYPLEMQTSDNPQALGVADWLFEPGSIEITILSIADGWHNLLDLDVYGSLGPLEIFINGDEGIGIPSYARERIHIKKDGDVYKATYVPEGVEVTFNDFRIKIKDKASGVKLDWVRFARKCGLRGRPRKIEESFINKVIRPTSSRDL